MQASDWLHVGTLVIAAHVLGVIAAIHAIINTRTSQGAVAWVVSLVAMPYFTLIPYLFLWRNKVRRLYRRTAARTRYPAQPLETRRIGIPARSDSPEATALVIDSSGARSEIAPGPAAYLGNPTIRTLQRLSCMPFLRGNAVRVLINGDATFAAILEAIDTAERYIVVQFFIVRGPAVASIQFVFTEDWYWATQRLPELGPAPSSDENMHCMVLSSGPADKQETCSLFFVEAINAARERIWITLPYLIPDEAVSSALRLAVMRGIDVRILIPSRRDHRVVFAASKLYVYDLVQAGVRVFLYKPGFLHQKVVLVDDIATSIGSTNLDNRSFRLNFEIIVLSVDRSFAHSFEIDGEDYRSASFPRRMAMHVARLFSPIL